MFEVFLWGPEEIYGVLRGFWGVSERVLGVLRGFGGSERVLRTFEGIWGVFEVFFWGF